MSCQSVNLSSNQLPHLGLAKAGVVRELQPFLPYGILLLRSEPQRLVASSQTESRKNLMDCKETLRAWCRSED